MKKFLVVAIAALLLAPVAGAAQAKENSPSATKAPSVTKEKLVVATASVVAVDQKKRIVTLKGAEGNLFDLKVGKEARNLPQVKVGDTVTIKYYQALAFEIKKPGTAPEGTSTRVAMERAPAGAKPYGAAGGKVTLTATITAINKQDQTVSLKGPKGKIVTVKAENPKNLEKIKVGDDVLITYTEAVAISVENAKKP
jgi:hypothetical protein